MARPARRQLSRLSEIAQIAAKHGFGYLFEHRRFSLRPWRLSDEELEAGEGSARGQRLRETLDELGPTFVKFGQLLSTRPDVVPPDIVWSSAALQDDVRPFPFAEVEETVAGRSSAHARACVPPLRGAAARRRLDRSGPPGGAPDRAEVAVKVQRPRAARQIEADIELPSGRALRPPARRRAVLHRYRRDRRRVRRSIRQELDYRLEARNAERFRRNFETERRCSCSARLLELFGGANPHARVSRRHRGRGRRRDPRGAEGRRALVNRIAEAWMTMIFRHGFFHGDRIRRTSWSSPTARSVSSTSARRASSAVTTWRSDAARSSTPRGRTSRRCRAALAISESGTTDRGRRVRERAARPLRPLLRSPALGGRSDHPHPGGSRPSIGSTCGCRRATSCSTRRSRRSAR